MARLKIKKAVLETLCDVLQMQSSEVLARIKSNPNSFSKYVAAPDRGTVRASFSKIRALAGEFSLQLPYYSFANFSMFEEAAWTEEDLRVLSELAFTSEAPKENSRQIVEVPGSDRDSSDLQKMLSDEDPGEPSRLAFTVGTPNEKSRQIVEILGSDIDSIEFQKMLIRRGILPSVGDGQETVASDGDGQDTVSSDGDGQETVSSDGDLQSTEPSDGEVRGCQQHRLLIGVFTACVLGAGFIWWRFSTAETNLPETNTSLKHVVNATDLQPAENEVTTAPQSLTGTLLPLKIDLSVSASRYQTLQKLLAHPEEYLSESEYQTVLSHLSSSLISTASFFELSARIPSAHFSRRRVSVNLPATPEDSQWVWFAIPSSGEPGRLPEVGLGANPVNLDLADEWVEIVLVVFSRSELRRKSLEITIEG